MKKARAFLLSLAAATSLIACQMNASTTDADGDSGAAASRSTTISSQYGSTTISPYTFYNNMWGSVSGSSQSMYVTSVNSWYVSAYQPYSTGGIKSYPNVSITASNIAVSSLTSTSTATTSTPSSGIWDQSWDIWVKGSSQNTNNSSTVTYEVMLWTNWIAGKMWPISDLYAYSSTYSSWVPSPFVSSVTVGGRTWNLYVGNNGSNAVYSFLAASKTNSCTVDIAAILKWLKSNTNPYDYTSSTYYSANGWKDSYIADKGKAYLPSNAYLYQLQYGWEIVSTTSTASSSATPSTLTFKTTAYSATAK